MTQKQALQPLFFINCDNHDKIRRSMMQSLKEAKIKRILRKSYCCYGNLLCHNIDSTMFTNDGAVVWYCDVHWHQASGYDDPAKSTSWNCAGDRFLKLPVIIGPVKLFCFPFKMGVSKGLKIVQ